jgi:hypothetical protein
MSGCLHNGLVQQVAAAGSTRDGVPRPAPEMSVNISKLAWMGF